MTSFKISIFLLLLAGAYSCNNPAPTNAAQNAGSTKTDSPRNASSMPVSNRIILTGADTSVTYFNEAFRLSIKTSDPDSFDYGQYNGTFSITRLRDSKLVLADSVGCMIPQFKFEDYNADGIKDILVYHEHGARANEYYYLYLADGAAKSFREVRQFEELPNAEMDSNGIITTSALYGKIGYKFYVIKNLGVQQVGETVEINVGEENDRVDREYKRVLKQTSRNNSFQPHGSSLPQHPVPHKLLIPVK